MAVDAFRLLGNSGVMTTTDDLVPLKVSGPEGLLAAVPTMLGFHPRDSLVLLCLTRLGWVGATAAACALVAGRAASGIYLMPKTWKLARGTE